jgi:hypothetical protein
MTPPRVVEAIRPSVLRIPWLTRDPRAMDHHIGITPRRGGQVVAWPHHRRRARPKDAPFEALARPHPVRCGACKWIRGAVSSQAVAPTDLSGSGISRKRHAWVRCTATPPRCGARGSRVGTTTESSAVRMTARHVCRIHVRAASEQAVVALRSQGLLAAQGGRCCVFLVMLRR